VSWTRHEAFFNRLGKIRPLYVWSTFPQKLLQSFSVVSQIGAQQLTEKYAVIRQRTNGFDRIRIPLIDVAE
jgi:hypothetical protein